MTIRSFVDLKPQIAPSVYIDDTALVIGDVTIEKESSVWPMAVLRGDINSIHIGKRSNIQDGTIVHVTHASAYYPDGYKVWVGDDVTIGHRCILHGCRLADHCLVGMGVCLMDGVQVESHVIIGAGSLVPPGKILTGGYLWLGSPARRSRKLTAEELEYLTYSANYYVKLKNRHKS